MTIVAIRAITSTQTHASAPEKPKSATAMASRPMATPNLLTAWRDFR